MTRDRAFKPRTISLTQLIHENRPVDTRAEEKKRRRRSAKYADLALIDNEKVACPVDDWDWYFKMRQGILP